VLKERIRAAEERRYDRRRARNCGPLYPMSSCHYRIADEVDVPVCINGFKNIFGLYRTRWEYLKKNSIGTSYIPGPVLHGNVIKMVELWKKWGKFVPLEFREELCPKPSDDVIKRVSKDRSTKSTERARSRRVQRSYELSQV